MPTEKITYVTIEDILRLKKDPDLSEAERQRIRESPLHPDLEKAFQGIAERRAKREHERIETVE